MASNTDQDLLDLTDPYDAQVAIAALTGGLAQSQQFHDKPSKVAVQPPSIEAANNVNSGARKRGSNTIATIDSNGRVVITGGRGITTGYETGVEGAAPAGYTSTSRPSGGIEGRIQGNLAPTAEQAAPSPLATLQSLMQDAQSAATVEEKLTKIYEVSGAYEASVAKFTQDAFKQAESEFKVQELKAQLDASIQEDMKDPLYERFKTDSSFTERVRTQYEGALSSANTQAAKYLSQNEEYSQMTGIMKPFIQSQLAMTQSLMNKKEGTDMKAEAMAESFGTSHLRLANIIEPGSGNDAKVATKYINDKEFKEVAVTMHTDPEALIPLALGGKNKYAKTALLDSQASIVAKTSDVTSHEYKVAHADAKAGFDHMKAITESDSVFQQAMTRFFPNKEERNKILAEYNLYGQDPSKGKERAAIRASMAPGLLSRMMKDDFESNVDSWSSSTIFKDPNSEIGKVYATLTEKPVSIRALVDALRKHPKELQEKARFELVQAGQKEASKNMNSLYGFIGDRIDMETKVNSYMAESMGVMDKLMEGFTRSQALAQDGRLVR